MRATDDRDAELTPLQTWRNRRKLAQICLKVVDHSDLSQSDKNEKMDLYRSQLAVIDGEIATITGKPPDISIELKPGIISIKPNHIK